MNVGEISILLSLDDKSFNHAISSAEDKARGFGDVLSGALSHTIGGLALDGIRALTGAIGDAFDKGKEFSSTMSEVAALTDIDIDSSSFVNLRDVIMDIGAKSKFTSAEVASGAAVMGAAGLSEKQILEGLPGLVALAAVENMSFAESSDVAVAAMTGFRMEASELGRVADVLTKTSSDSNVSVKTLGQSFKYISPVAGQLKLDFEDVNAALGVLGNVGLKGSMAGRNLASGLMSLAGPTDKAKGLMASLGIEVNDAAGNFKQLPDLIDNLNHAFQGMSDAQKVAALNTLVGKDNMKTWLPLIDAGKEKIDAFSASLEDSQGAAADMAAKKMDNLAGSIEYFQGNLESVTTKAFLGWEDGLKDIMKDANSLVTVGAPYILKFSEIARDGFMGVYAAIRMLITNDYTKGIFSLHEDSPLPTFIFALRRGLIFLKNIVTDAFGEFKSGEPIIYGFTRAISTLLIPLGDLGIALNVVSNAFGYFVTKDEEYLGHIQVALDRLWTKVKDVFSSIVTYIVTNLPIWVSTLQEWGNAAWQWIVNAVPLALSSILEWRNELVNFVLSSLPSWIDTLASWVTALGSWIISAIPLALSSFTYYTVELIKIIGNALPGIIDKLNYYSIALLEWITSSTPGATSELGGYVGQILDAIGNALPGIVTSLGRWAGALIEWVIQAAPKLLDNLITLVNDLGTWIAERVPVIAGYLATWVEAAWQWIEIVWPKLSVGLLAMLTSLQNWILEKGPVLVTTLAEWAWKFIEFIAPYIPKVLEKLGVLLADILQWIVGKAPEIFEKLKEWGNSFANWVKDTAVPYLQEKLPLIWTALTDWISEKVTAIKQDGSIGSAMVDGMQTGFNTSWDGFKKNSDTKFTELSNDLTRQVTELFSFNTLNKMADGLFAWLNATAANLPGQYAGVVTSFNQFTNSLGDLFFKLINWLASEGITKFSQFFSSLADKLFSFLNWLSSDGIKGLMTFFNDFAANIFKWLNETADQSIGMKIVRNIQQGMTTAAVGLGVVATNIGMSIKDKIMEWTGAMKDAGWNLIENFWHGISERFNNLMGDMAARLQDLRNLLPGSEPKDSTSPLFGLGASGQALIENFQGGIDAANLSVMPQLNALSAQIGATTNTPVASPLASTATTNTPVIVNINNPSAGTDIRSIEEAGYRGAQRALKEQGKSAELRSRTG